MILVGSYAGVVGILGHFRWLLLSMGYGVVILLASMLPDSLLIVLRLVELLRTQHPDRCQGHILLSEDFEENLR